MAQHNYSFQGMKDNMVRAVGRNLDISPKESIEICTYVRGRPLTQAKMLLHQSIDMIRAVPLRRFSNGAGHRSGMGPGRYYPKACSAILKIIESAEANAKNKGFNSNDLKLIHIAMQIGPKNWHYGRQRRSIFKNSHIEVVLAEVKGLSDKKAEHKAASGKSVNKNAKPAAKDVKHNDKEVKTAHTAAKKE